MRESAFRLLILMLALATPLQVVGQNPGPGMSGPAIGDDTPDPEEEGDGWEGIPFERKDFAEVRRFARLFHMDSNFDDRRAWVRAANQVLHVLSPSREAVPEAWWRAFRKRPEAIERYQGPGEVPWPGAPFRILLLQRDRNTPRSGPGRSWAERSRIARSLRESQDRTWARIPFQEPDFERVMSWVMALPEEARGTGTARLWIAASQGFLAALDPHSTIVSARAWEESTRQVRDGAFEGIGAVLIQRGEDILFEAPMEGQPAFQAGIRAGDVLMAVDDRPVRGLSLRQVIRRIRGPRGTSVTLTVHRLGSPRDLVFTVVRDFIEVPNVTARLLDRRPDVGYLKIGGFVAGTREAVSQAIGNLVAQTRGKRLRGLVLDLRNNPGGLLQEAVEIADDFLEEGVIVTVRNAGDRQEVHRARPGGWTFPVVVLQNAASASASEILASALQENGRALVVGERSFGKASVQTLLTPLMRRDYHIKLTVARYFGPSGRTLQVLGVEPDIPVPPGPGQDFPPAFREEDLHFHLPPMPGGSPPRTPLPVPLIQTCERRLGVAETQYRREAASLVRPDYALWKAADYLECLMAMPGPSSPSSATRPQIQEVPIP